MIFVTVGTNEAPFDRLVRAVDRLAGAEEVVAQCGSSSHRPVRAVCVDFLGFEELVELIREARIVVTHAGAGSVMVALANAKHPVVVPRLRRHREAVDDHQLAFAQRLAERGLVTLLEDPSHLPEAIAAIHDQTVAVPPVAADGRLVEHLQHAIDTSLAQAPRSSWLALPPVLRRARERYSHSGKRSCRRS